LVGPHHHIHKVGPHGHILKVVGDMAIAAGDNLKLFDFMALCLLQPF
jgi:hypothetical protein